MAIVRCPSCAIPLTADEEQALACPVCSVPFEPKAVVPIAEKTAPPNTRIQTSYVQLGAGAAILLLSVGGLWLANQASRPESKKGSSAAEAAKPRAIALAWASPQVKPLPMAPQETKTPTPRIETKLIVPAPLPGPGPAARAKPDAHPTPAEPKTGEAVAVREPAQRGILIVGNDRLVRLPDGEYAIPELVRGTKVKLTGVVKTLRIGLVDGGSFLDASGLDVQRIIFTRPITGGSTVKVFAPNGSVEFRGAIDGRANVKVDAPDGKVTFTESAHSSGRVLTSAESRVAITARDVDFRAALDGVNTTLLVVLTRGGSLRFHRLERGTRLYYRKADPGDPAPRVGVGRITPPAEFRKVD